MTTQITQAVVRQALDEFVGSVILSTTNGPKRIFETKEVLFGFGISDEELNDLIACLMFNITSRNLTPFNDRMNEIVNRF